MYLIRQRTQIMLKDCKLPEPLKQKYKSAYYCFCNDTHYVMFDAVRIRYDTKDIALQVCEGINNRRGLPHINVEKSSIFNQEENYVS